MYEVLAAFPSLNPIETGSYIQDFEDHPLIPTQHSSNPLSKTST